MVFPVLQAILLPAVISGSNLDVSPKDSYIYVYETSEELELSCNYTGSGTYQSIEWSDTFPNATYSLEGKSLIYEESTFHFGDEGTTTCLVKYTESGTQKSSTHTFNIEFPEMENYGNAVAGVAETATLGCQIAGDNTTEIDWSWSNGSEPTSGIATSFANSVSSSNLTVSTVALRDGGNFSCVVEEAADNVLLVVYSVVCSPSQMALTGAKVEVFCLVEISPPGEVNVSLNLDGEKGVTDKKGSVTAMTKLSNIQDDDSLSWSLEIDGSKVKSGVIEIYAFNSSDLACPLLEFSSGSLECESSTCTFTCPSDQYYQSGDSLLTNKTVTCDGSTSQWSHTSKDNPLGDLPICSAKVVAKSRSLVADINFTGTTSCTSELKTDLVSYFTGSSSYPCFNADTCTLTSSDVTCTASSSKVTLKATVTQKGSSAAGIYAFESQLTSNPTSISLTLGKRKRSTDFPSSGSGIMRELDRLRRSTTVTSTSVNSSYKVECGTGAGQVGSECLQCPAGSYSSSSGTCEKCARGYYQPNSGSSQCAQCDKGFSTVTTGSDSITDCTVTCEVAPISNGHRSPASGYTVSEETPIATFCGSGYSILPHEMDFGPCFENQPSCYKSCMIEKKSDNAVVLNGITHVGYKYILDYECSNKEGEMFEAACEIEGSNLELTCPSDTLMIILICVAAVLLVLIIAGIILIRRKSGRREPTPPPQEEPVNSVISAIRRSLGSESPSFFPSPIKIDPVAVITAPLASKRPREQIRPKETESSISSDTSVIGVITGTFSSLGRSIRGFTDD